jgi:hypothetical protein
MLLLIQSYEIQQENYVGEWIGTGADMMGPITPTHIYIYMYVCVCLCVYIYTHTYIHTHTHTHTHTLGFNISYNIPILQEHKAAYNITQNIIAHFY